MDLHALVLDLHRPGSGLGYVYRCLDQVMHDLELEELVLVVDNAVLGRQVFWPSSGTLGRLTIDQLRAGPGLYARPDRVGADDAEVITALCEMAIGRELHA